MIWEDEYSIQNDIMWEMVKGLCPNGKTEEAVTASSSVRRPSLKRQILSFGDGSYIGVPCRGATLSVRKKQFGPKSKRLASILNVITGQPEAFSAAMNTCSAALISLVVETFTRANCPIESRQQTSRYML